MPHVEFLSAKKLTRKDLIEIYKQCFMGLRLTVFDGNANTALELGLMGRKVMSINDFPNCMKWEVDFDVNIDIINEELKSLDDDYEKANIESQKLATETLEYVKKYSNILN